MDSALAEVQYDMVCILAHTGRTLASRGYRVTGRPKEIPGCAQSVYLPTNNSTGSEWKNGSPKYAYVRVVSISI